MIQRIQSVYLLITLIALIIVSLGADVFKEKIKGEPKFEVVKFELIRHANVYGTQGDLKLDGELNETEISFISEILKVHSLTEMKGLPIASYPFYLFTILLSLLTVYTILSYKNLKKQLTLSRLLFVLNFILFIGAGILFYMFKTKVEGGWQSSSSLSVGFYCIICAIAFSYLGMNGVKRDLDLIKSIDRIR